VERTGAWCRLFLVPPELADAPDSPVLGDDPDVLSGNWTWIGDTDGQLQFRVRGGLTAGLIQLGSIRNMPGPELASGSFVRDSG